MSSEVVVFRRAVGQLWKGATVVGAVFGATAASSALSYVTSFPTASARAMVVATTSGDAGLAVLLGPVGGVGTVGGYTVYKGFAFLTTIGAVWAALAATRVLRGEEDAGRWQLMAAGATRSARVTAATVAALAVAITIVVVETTLAVSLAGVDHRLGFSVGDSLLYGLSLGVAPAVFVAVGAVASQLGGTRRTANGWAMGAVAMSFVVRMVADAGPSTRWLRWATPFGWVELIDPFGANRWWPLVPTGLTTLGLAWIAVALSAHRDVGRGVVASRVAAPARRFGLGSPTGLAARLEVPSLAVWCAGAAACGVMLGVIGEMTTRRIPDSFNSTLQRFGVHGGFTAQYFGVAFLLVAAVVSLLPASQVGRAADEETSGRLVHVLVGPAGRGSWMWGRLAIAAVGAVAAGAAAGVGAWVGAVSQGLDVGFATLLGAGLNVVPTALVALSFGALVMATMPRAAGRAVYLIVGWSLIIDLVSSMVSGMAWLGHLSLFHSLALVPAQPVNWSTVAFTLAVAAVAAAVSVAVFRMRSLRTA